MSEGVQRRRRPFESMSIGWRQITTGLVLIVGIYIVIKLVVGFHQLDVNQSAMAKAAKAAGLIDRRLPANCTRVEMSSVDSSWGTLDEPAWNQADRRCSPFSRKLMIVLHRVGGRFRVVTTRTAFGHFGDCAVPGVPHAVSRSLPLC
jgi:hypothetical protein